MVDARHKAQTIAEGIHSPISFEYANEAARLAAGPFESYDKNKFALQLDTNQIYVLTSTLPIVWETVSGSAISGDLDMDGYDIIDVGTVDGVDVSSHADRHEAGGADALEVSDLGTSEVNAGLVLKPDGVGGVVWGAGSGAVSTVFGRVGDVAAAIDDYSASQIDNDSTVTGEQVSDALEYLDGYVASVAQDVADIATMTVGGDLSGNLPNPSVVDLTITSEEQGSVLYFDGTNWAQLPPGTDGYALITHDTGANPSWGEVATTAPVTSVFGRVGDVVSATDDYSASQIDNDSTVSGEQVSDALEYLDGYVNHATRHENGGPDEIEISNLGTSENNPLLVLQPDGAGGVVWSVPSGGGDVVGPAGATDNAIALFDGGTGKVLKNSLVTIDGSGNISTPGMVDGYALGVEFYDINAQLDILGGILGGDLSGTLPNPSVVDLTITSEEQGSVLYFNGTNWVQLPPGADGYALITHDTGANPTWGEVATTAPVTSVFGRVGDVVVGIDDYSASQIDNDSTVTGEQVSDALEYLDGYISSHAGNLNNPHQTSIGNIEQGTLAELNLAILDATLDDISGTRTPTAHATSHEEGESDAIDGYQVQLNYVPVNYVAPVNPIIGEHIAAIDDALASSGLVDSVFGRVGDVIASIDDYSASQIDNDSTVTGEQVSDALEYLDGYIGDVYTLPVGGDLSGNLPNPSVVDLSITGEEQGSVLYFNGANWVQLPPGSDGYALITHDTGANPTWGEVAGSSPVTSVFGRIGDIVASIDDYSASQIDNDSSVVGEQISDALEYLDGYVNHANRHENGGPDEIEISNLGTSEVNTLLVLQPDGIGGVVWSVAGGGGDVVGPAGATDSAIALFDAGTGKVLKNSLVTIDGSGNISTPGMVDGYYLGSEFYDINAQLDILGGILGGDLSGTLPNPSVTDLTITGEEQGSVLYFDGANWIQLSPGADGYALITHDTGANPTWGEVATTVPVTSVFGRIGDVIAAIDDYSASQIDNDSTVPGEQVSGALEYLDGYVDHADRHEYGGGDPVDGYQIGLVYTPTNYNPPGTDIIGEHIAEIDAALGEIVGSGYVVGPAIATDNAIVRYDGTTGDLVQNSGILIDNSDNVSGVETVAIGATPAQTGAIRLTNNEGIYWAGIGEVDFPGDRKWKLLRTIPSTSLTGTPNYDGWVRLSESSFPDEALTSGSEYEIQGGGTDLAASLDELGTIRLAVQVVRCYIDAAPANSRVEIWIRYPGLSELSDNPLWIWWGSTTKTLPANDADYGRDDVWNGTTGGGTPPVSWAVYHFDESPAESAPQIKDASGNGRDVSIVSGTWSRSEGVCGRYWTLDSGTPSLQVASATSLSPGTDPFSLLAFKRHDANGDVFFNALSTTSFFFRTYGCSLNGSVYNWTEEANGTFGVYVRRNGTTISVEQNTSSYSNTVAAFANSVAFASVQPILCSTTEAVGNDFGFTALLFCAPSVSWYRAWYDSITDEANFYDQTGTIEAASPAVENVRGIIVDANNDVVVGDADNSLVLEASDYILNKVDGYEVMGVYDGYVDVANNDIRNIKTATFNEWPTLTPDEDGYVTVDFRSYQKATVDLNDEAAITITINEPQGPGDFTIILKQGAFTATVSLTWVAEGSYTIYGPSGAIAYAQDLGSITVVELRFDGADWFCNSIQPMEPVS